MPPTFSSPPSLRFFYFPSPHAAAANLTNRIILHRGLNGFRSILNTHPPPRIRGDSRSVSFLFSSFFFFFLSFFRTTNIEIAVSSFVQLNSRYCKCTKHNNVEAVGNSFCVRDNALKYYKLCKGTLVRVVYASIGTSSSNSSKVSR